MLAAKTYENHIISAMHTTQRINFLFRVDATASRVQSAVTTKKVSKSMEVKVFLKVLKSESEFYREW